jgi:protein-S-isoprenylcysteine O-methyltransferase Ste14
MRLASLLNGLTVGIAIFLGLPYVLIIANDMFKLPVFYNPIMQVFGVSFVVLGATVFAYCSGLFAIRGRGTPVPIDPLEILVTSGLYKYTRNPMYLSYLSIFLGEFMFLGHVSLLIYFFLMCVFINVFVIKFEEPELKKRFGQKYIIYTKSVPRFIPR